MTASRGHSNNALAILGGGPAGLAVAFYSHRAGVPFVLFDKSAQFGGLCRTFECGGHKYDSGAHRFHDRDAEITDDVRRLVKGQLVRVSAPSKIYDQGKFLDFPPTPLNLALSLGPVQLWSFAFDVLRARWRSSRRVSFADFAIHQFGEKLARRLVLDYSEKVWGLPGEQLSVDAATRRLKGITLGSLLLELFAPGRKTAHIDGDFLYPRRGYGQITDALQSALPAESLFAGCEVTAFEVTEGLIRRVHFASHPPFEVSGRVVSTLPLPLLAKLLGDELPPETQRAAQRLRFRHIRMFFLRIDQARISPNASIYFPDPHLCISRVSEPKNRSCLMAPAHETSLIVEVPCFSEESLASMSPEDLADRVIGELDQVGLLAVDRVIEWKHHFLANAYPVYSLDYPGYVAEVTKGLARIANLDTMGRNGQFLYSHLHDQLRFAKNYTNA